MKLSQFEFYSIDFNEILIRELLDKIKEKPYQHKLYMNSANYFRYLQYFLN